MEYEFKRDQSMVFAANAGLVIFALAILALVYAALQSIGRVDDAQMPNVLIWLAGVLAIFYSYGYICMRINLQKTYLIIREGTVEGFDCAQPKRRRGIAFVIPRDAILRVSKTESRMTSRTEAKITVVLHTANGDYHCWGIANAPDAARLLTPAQE
jgi:hypothetical protein